MEEWPEGPYADQDAARERYEQDVAAVQRRLRGSVRADLRDAHLGLGIVVVAAAIGWAAGGPAVGGSIAGAFAVLYAVTLAVMRGRGVRGRDAARRAYLFGFGWANVL